MLQKIKDLSIRVKLFAVLLLPLAGMLYYAGIAFNDRLQLNQQMKQLQFMTQLLAESVHASFELMNEANAILAKSGESEAKQKTDQQLTRLKLALEASHEQTSLPAFLKQVQRVSTILEQLPQIRAQALQQKDPMKSSQGYLQLTAEIKRLSDQLSRMNTHSETASIANALTMLFAAQVRAAQEEWVLGHTFQNDFFPEGYYGHFLQLASEQATYLTTFSELVDHADLRAALEEIKKAAPRQAINKLHDEIRQIYLDGNFGIGQSTVKWHQLSQSWRDQLYHLSEQSTAQLMQLTEAQVIASRNGLMMLASLQVGVLLLIVLLSLSVIRIISGQLISLNKVIMQIAQDHNLRLRIPVFSQDEIGQASQSFNNMLDAFANIIQQVRDASTQLSSAADNTLRVSHQMEQEINEGHRQVEMVAAAMEEMHSTVQEVAQYAADAMLQADRTNLQTAEGRSVVDASIAAIRQLEQDLSTSSETVNSLSRDTTDIESMVDVIRTIAEQTNLLALNAAIEAARAGEQGRGFAVVADEVRTLAQRTQNSTREIEAVISRIRLSSDETVTVMQHSFGQVKESTTYADSAQVALVEISASITKITDMNTQVATATEQQSATVEEINRNVSLIRQRYADTATASHKVEQSSQTLSGLSHRLESMVQQFSV